jgi:hypothetical protein
MNLYFNSTYTTTGSCTESETEPSVENGKTMLTSKDVCKMLKISTRTLQRYRDNGKIAFTQITRKLILYSYNDVQNLINQNFKPMF